MISRTPPSSSTATADSTLLFVSTVTIYILYLHHHHPATRRKREQQQQQQQYKLVSYNNICNNENDDLVIHSNNCSFDDRTTTTTSTTMMHQETVLQLRQQYFSNSLSISYNNTKPLMIIKGNGCYLYESIYHDDDIDGNDVHVDKNDDWDETNGNLKTTQRRKHTTRMKQYLDTRNNVAHIGHCHPIYVKAVQEQISLLNTNTRYLHPTICRLAQKLLLTFHTNDSNSNHNEQLPLTKVFFCNSGSEANDMALRLTRAYAIMQYRKKKIQQQQQQQQNNDNDDRNQQLSSFCLPKNIQIITVDHAYHGHTIATLDISSYKYKHSKEYERTNTTTGSTTTKEHTNNTDSTSNDKNYDSNPKCDTVITSDEETRSKQQDQTVSSSHTYDVIPTSATICHDNNDSDNRNNEYYTRPSFVIKSVPCPNIYTGLYQNPNTAGKLYAQHIELICSQHTTTTTTTNNDNNTVMGAFMIESGMSVAGVIVPPKNYLYHTVQAIRNVDGLYIVDEVQTGFGRFGSCYWGYQYNHNSNNERKINTNDEIEIFPNPIPDIVTVGKPFGNGMPLAAVIVNDKVNAAFEECNVEYFNTFGGNPVCTMAGLMVLDIIEKEQLQQNALQVGTYLIEQLQALQRNITIPYIGDVRGSGLFIGIEFVLDRITKQPATKLVSWLCSQLKMNIQY
jgi:4-aminobutyrate aminotransferase-like enzyme